MDFICFPREVRGAKKRPCVACISFLIFFVCFIITVCYLSNIWSLQPNEQIVQQSRRLIFQVFRVFSIVRRSRGRIIQSTSAIVLRSVETKHT